MTAHYVLSVQCDACGKQEESIAVRQCAPVLDLAVTRDRLAQQGWKTAAQVTGQAAHLHEDVCGACRL